MSLLKKLRIAEFCYDFMFFTPTLNELAELYVECYKGRHRAKTIEGICDVMHAIIADASHEEICEVLNILREIRDIKRCSAKVKVMNRTYNSFNTAWHDYDKHQVWC